MNIAAYMAACDLWDVDSRTKHVIQVIAGRSDRYTASTRVSLARLAADMGTHKTTAMRAVERAVEAGYVTVDKSRGRPFVYQLVSCTHATSMLHLCTAGLRGCNVVVASDARIKESLDTTKESDAASRSPKRAASPVDKPGLVIVGLDDHIDHAAVTEALNRHPSLASKLDTMRAATMNGHDGGHGS